MKYAIGYQQPENGDSFSDIVSDYREHISEVYFPWIGAASGRAALGSCRGGRDWKAQSVLEDDLRFIKSAGIRLDLLFNSNCYGERAASQSLENEVLSILEHLDDLVKGVDTVTTTSLAVARTVKKYFPEIDVRASVNMRIGTVQAMGYVSGLYDSFYIQRDIQRDLSAVRKIKAWCDANGKKLYMLANSGCLHCCPGQVFHDNMVAHDAAIDEMKNIPGWTPHVCWNLYRDPANFVEILRSTWVRPEDIHNYELTVEAAKLATRQHSNPRIVIGAYASEKYAGNTIDLFEPGFSPAFAPAILDNSRFPEDWFDKTSTCGRDCEKCDYCANVLKEIQK